MEEDKERLELRSNRLQKMAVGTLFVFALTWGLPFFFNVVFFFLAVYLFFLSWYYKPRVLSSQENDGGTPGNRMARKIWVIAALAVFGFFFLLLLAGLFSKTQSGETAEDLTVSNSGDELQKELRVDPTNIEALTSVGNEFLLNSEYDSAIIYFTRVLTLDQQNDAALYNLGMIYYNQTEYSKSIDFLKRCVEFHPENGDACLLLGHDYYDQQMQDDAFIWYNKAYEKGVRNAFLSHVLGYLYDTRGNATQAVVFYKQAVEQDSSRADIYTRLAELEPEKAGQYTELANRWKSN